MEEQKRRLSEAGVNRRPSAAQVNRRLPAAQVIRRPSAAQVNRRPLSAQVNWQPSIQNYFYLPIKIRQEPKKKDEVIQRCCTPKLLRNHYPLEFSRLLTFR